MKTHYLDFCTPSNKISLGFLVLILLSFSVMGSTDMDNKLSEQNSFLITEDTIELQQTQSQAESQALSKEAEFRLKLALRENQGNKLWTLFTATSLMFKEIIVIFLLGILMRLIAFIVVEILPFTMGKFLDFFEGVIKK